MTKIKIVTDSSVTIKPEVAKELDITIVPLSKSDWILRLGRLSLLNFLNVAIWGLLKTNFVENLEYAAQAGAFDAH